MYEIDFLFYVYECLCICKVHKWTYVCYVFYAGDRLRSQGKALTRGGRLVIMRFVVMRIDGKYLPSFFGYILRYTQHAHGISIINIFLRFSIISGH